MVVDTTRYVQVGRVAYIAYGPDKGKLCTVIDVIDQNRALVDGPCTNVARQQIRFKALHLTQFVLKIERSMRAGKVKKAWENAKMTEKWNETTWAKKIASREKRAQVTDLDRFKLMKAKQARNRLVRMELGKLKKAAKAAPKKTKVVKKKKPSAKK